MFGRCKLSTFNVTFKVFSINIRFESEPLYNSKAKIGSDTNLITQPFRELIQN